MLLSVYNMAGQVADRVELSDQVFGVPVNQALLHQAMVIQMGNQRLGTVDTKTRAEVAGGGGKVWRQKGTGRARQGSRRAPHWRGGGAAFGPHPRSYYRKMPKKARRLALKCALSAKVAENKLILLDELRLEEPKTKVMLEVLQNLSVDRSALIVLEGPDPLVVKSAGNIPGVSTLPAHSLHTLAVLRHQHLLMPIAAARQVEARLT